MASIITYSDLFQKTLGFMEEWDSGALSPFLKNLRHIIFSLNIFNDHPRPAVDNNDVFTHRAGIIKQITAIYNLMTLKSIK